MCQKGWQLLTSQGKYLPAAISSLETCRRLKYKIYKHIDAFCENYRDVNYVKVLIFFSFCIVFTFWELVCLSIVIPTMVTLLFALIVQLLHGCVAECDS